MGSRHTVYGERDHQRREEPILRRVRAGRDRVPAGSGGWLWTRGYVRDVATGIRLALESDATVAEILNLGEARTWSMGLWARHVLEAAGSGADLVRVPDVLLPDDLKPLGAISRHLLVGCPMSRYVPAWSGQQHLLTSRFEQSTRSSRMGRDGPSRGTAPVCAVAPCPPARGCIGRLQR
jgi:uncharacterized protein YbjT (DUF2867 family)